MGTTHRSGVSKKSNDRARLIITAVMGMVFGYFIGVSFPSVSLTNIHIPANIRSSFEVTFNDDHQRTVIDHMPENRVSTDTAPPKVFLILYDVKFSSKQRHVGSFGLSGGVFGMCWQHFLHNEMSCILVDMPMKHGTHLYVLEIYVPTNPRGAESLPPGIIVSESDFYLRRLWGEPSEDLKRKPKYLVTFTVGLEQRDNIDAAVKKFSDDFQILLFHYDGWTSEWDQFEWSQRAVHVSVRKQTKWWYAKRFLHPDIVSAYEYIFIWDEDLGVEHFNGQKYIQLVKKHGLEISQPGLEPNNGLTWQMTKRRGDREVHKNTDEKPGWCSDPHLPPCAAFVEIMAPVFSREAWRCVWHMIQPAHEKIGVVDSQWVVHQVIPSLGNQATTYIDDYDIRATCDVESCDKRIISSGLFMVSHISWEWEALVQVAKAWPPNDEVGQSENGKAPWQGVRERCRSEWAQFQDRLADADKTYLAQIGKG
ncbi:trimethylguanosine synthase [Actinidia rufa]|uniref:Trimethylguanosine synthase n=1 Tax=Actinidia rufa TaxID=165716 RepID=A0A7J0H4B4_9ERIC|nr:trimethylguanosine synthase [Actinidia rufa]